MISVAENLRETAGQAEHKAHDLARPGRHAVSAMPAGAYIGIGEVLLVAVSNMALCSLAIPDGTAGFGDLGRSLLFAVPGNIVGGGALVACAYWFTGRPDRASDSSYE
ncbi:hypothetical protein ABZ572_20740 [Streptomyces sp. NPDC018338]|uniref:hypothetical protein n=1 Tax=Streptomyces sp. NPDC018338 TaxID=3157192 RepID=UPI0033F8438D